GGAFDRISGGIETVAALLRGLRGPCRLGPPGGGGCRVDVCRAALTRAVDDLTGGWVAELAPVGDSDRRAEPGRGREGGGPDATCVGMVPVGTVPVRLVVRSTVNVFTASVDGSRGPRLGSAGGVLDDSRIIADRGLHRSVGQNAAAESGGRLADDAAEEAG